MPDTYTSRGLQQKMLDFLAAHAVPAPILRAFAQVPRHLFLESALMHRAYRDEALPIACGQTISRPLTVAKQTELLEVQKGEKILEVGTGSAFHSMILSALGARVYTIERHRALYMQAKTHPLNAQFAYPPQYFYGDGFAGLSTFAPFSKILVTAGASGLPKSLFAQLVEGGIVIIPVGNAEDKQMWKVVKREGRPEVTRYGSYAFVPLVKGIAAL